MTLPKLKWRWALSRTATWLLAQLTGTPLTVRGLEHLPAGPCVLVANHSSFLDAYVLMATIPRRFHYVAKRELLDNRWIAPAATDRYPVRRALRHTAQRRRSPQDRRGGARRPLARFFPEGTFKRMPGLLSFRMGAFLAAAQAGTPVVPVTIRGTRSMLRAGSWFPRRGRLEVRVEAPVQPDGDDWAAAVRLRPSASGNSTPLR